ncbi:MAG: hypothetical protein AB7I19_09070 [Planctomycetota bacterium]
MTHSEHPPQSNPSARPRVRLGPILLVEGLVLGILLVVLLAGRAGNTPELRWQFGEVGETRDVFAELPPGFPLRLEIDLPEPMHVYVASHDAMRGNIAMWPSAQLQTEAPSNPVPAGRQRLPGSFKGQEVQWHVGDGVGVTTFFVIASRQPIADLNRAMASFRQLGNAAFPDRRMCSTYAPKGGMDSVPPPGKPGHDLLAWCADQAADLHDGAMKPIAGRPGAFFKTMRVITPLPDAPLDLDSAQKALADRFGPLQDMVRMKPEALGPSAPATPPRGR